MGRKKKEKPSQWRGVEWYLRREEAIREAVKEYRAEFSFLTVSQWGGNGKGGSGRKTDRTSKLAEKLTEELPAVVLNNGDTINRPESWLAVFDAVKNQAEGLNRPEWIFNVWAQRYGEGLRYVGELITGRIYPHEYAEGFDHENIIFWIIYHVEEAAVSRGIWAEADSFLYGRDVGTVRYIETCGPQKLD